MQFVIDVRIQCELRGHVCVSELYHYNWNENCQYRRKSAYQPPVRHQRATALNAPDIETWCSPRRSLTTAHLWKYIVGVIWKIKECSSNLLQKSILQIQDHGKGICRTSMLTWPWSCLIAIMIPDTWLKTNAEYSRFNFTATYRYEVRHDHVLTDFVLQTCMCGIVNEYSARMCPFYQNVAWIWAKKYSYVLCVEW